jgi:ribosomal 50S subunit-recycling heat shock protein
MRLDKFLKVSRLIKRRTVANDACNAAKVCVNGKPAKPSKELKIGDKLEISFGEKKILVEVLSLIFSKDAEMYKIL